jgi:N4-(beta-N-acetylglucosaminyl)-L-asparaginase
MIAIMNRKDFIKISGLGMAAINLPKWEGHSNKPIVISTWDSGMPVNAEAWKILSAKGKSLDAVEAGARHIEDTTNCCVGLGGYPDRNGIVTLDACIMDEKANCGAVAGLERIKHPISLARKVMETTPHVMLVGQGAQDFALQNGFTLESTELSDDAKDAYKKWLEKTQYKPEINIENKKQNGPFAPNFFDDGSVNHDTMGLVAMDHSGDLSGAVTTSGMAFKIHGRVGDSPIIGAGLFVDNEIGAAASSGVGEEVIRICGTHTVVEYMRHGYSPEAACKKACERIVKRDREKAKTLQVGFLALNKKGEYGAYAIQKGFVFSVKSDSENQIHQSKYLL